MTKKCLCKPITPNHSQAGQCHLKNQGRYQRVPRRLKNYYSKNQTTAVAYRRKKLPVYPDLDALLIQFSIYSTHNLPFT